MVSFEELTAQVKAQGEVVRALKKDGKVMSWGKHSVKGSFTSESRAKCAEDVGGKEVSHQQQRERHNRVARCWVFGCCGTCSRTSGKARAMFEPCLFAPWGETGRDRESRILGSSKNLACTPRTFSSFKAAEICFDMLWERIQWQQGGILPFSTRCADW